MGEAETNGRRVLDIAALLEDTAIRLKLGETEYVIRDLPVSLVMDLQAKAGQMNDRDFVAKALASAGIPVEEIDKLGARATAALAMRLMDFFVPSDLVAKMGLSATGQALFQTGLRQLRTSSPNTPDTTASES